MVGSPPMGHLAGTSALPVMTHGAQILDGNTAHERVKSAGAVKIQCPASYGGES